MKSKKMFELVKNIISLVRMNHWVKNGFVFLPVFFAGKIELIFTSNLLLLFISFCLASSAIYILNDMVDVNADKLHPTKKFRPIASGFFSINQSIVLFTVTAILFFLSLLLLAHAGLYVLSYFVLNILYSFYLKHLSIVDVSSISAGFVLRELAGGAESNVYVSHWMIIMTFLLTVSIGFAKRRDDLVLVLEKESSIKSLDGYTIPFLDIAKSISFSITLISYILYSISAEVIARIGSDKLYITSLFVFLGIIRYIQITVVDKNSGSPIEVLWKDKFLQITLLLWAFTFLFIIYGKGI
ncbi:MAG: UbiA prenyltransferase family protein [Bacteroidia bacterium]